MSGKILICYKFYYIFVLLLKDRPEWGLVAFLVEQALHIKAESSLQWLGFESCPSPSLHIISYRSSTFLSLLSLSNEGEMLKNIFNNTSNAF